MIENNLLLYIQNDNFNAFSSSINTLTRSITPGKIISDNRTLLLHSCHLKKYNFSIKLIETYGRLCNIDYRDSDNFTAIEYIIKQLPVNLSTTPDSLKNLFFLLLDLSNSKTCNAAFRTSIFEGNCELINILIDSGKINLNYINPKGRSFVMYAIQKKLPSVVKKLLELSNIDLSQKDIYNYTVSSLVLENMLDSSIISQILTYPKDNLNDVNDVNEHNKLNHFHLSDFYSNPERGFQEGGYGQIYPLVNKSTNKTCILKKYFKYLDDHLINDDIVREILFLRRINLTYHSKFFTNLLGFVEHNKDFYTVLKPLDLTATQYFKLISYTPEYSHYMDNFVLGCLNALYSLHCLGIVHSDLKKDNIMVNNGSIYIIDFGISIFFGFGNSTIINQSYFSTPNITAPEGINFTILLDGEEFPNERYRLSYNVDIYSLGSTILDIIFDTSAQYISNDKIIYEIPAEDSKSKRKNFIRLSDEKFKLLLSFNLETVNLLINMISYNPTKRPSLKTVLGYDRKLISSNVPVSEYFLDNINNLQYRLCKSIFHYTPEHIRNKKYELEYYEEIHANYQNDCLIVPEYQDTAHHEMLLKAVDHLVDIMMKKEVEFSLDVLVNTIHMLQNYLFFSFDSNDSNDSVKSNKSNNSNDLTKSNKSINQDNSYDQNDCDHLNKITFIILNICQYIGSVDYISPFDFSIFSFEMPEIENLSRKFFIDHAAKIIYYPIMLHIQYIVINLQICNVESSIISKIEWYIMKGLLLHFLTTPGQHNIWIVCCDIFMEYCQLNHLNIKSFNFLNNTQYCTEGVSFYQDNKDNKDNDKCIFSIQMEKNDSFQDDNEGSEMTYLTEHTDNTDHFDNTDNTDHFDNADRLNESFESTPMSSISSISYSDKKDKKNKSFVKRRINNSSLPFKNNYSNLQLLL